MVITPLFSRITTPITISIKLGLEVHNLTDDDIEDKSYIKKSLLDELDIYNKERITMPVKNRFPYSLKGIMQSDYYRECFEKDILNNDNECINVLCSKILMIYCIDSQSSMMPLKNEFCINPTCEMSLEQKFIRFLTFLESYKSFDTKRAEINITYNDNEYGHYTGKSDIIRSMLWRLAPKELEENNPYRFVTHEEEYQCKINGVIHLGKLIDNFIESQQDFYIIDYLMDAISSYENHGAFGIVKMTSLVEMLLANPKYKSLRYELRHKLPQFLSDDIHDKDLWIKYMYDIRSKIAHGDYSAISAITSDYQKTFMQNFECDYYEYNLINWIYSDIYLHLSSAVGNIIRTYLNMKPLINKIKGL